MPISPNVLGEKKEGSKRGEKRCPKCDNVMSIEMFYKNTAQKDGRCIYCKKCWRNYEIEKREACKLRKDLWIKHHGLSKKARHITQQEAYGNLLHDILLLAKERNAAKGNAKEGT